MSEYEYAFVRYVVGKSVTRLFDPMPWGQFRLSFAARLRKSCEIVRDNE